MTNKGLDIKVKHKIQYVFELIKQVDRVPQKFLSPIVLFNGFQKKTRKTPREEIDRAMRLKHEYFNLKRQKNEKE
jgi:hypothetical protein